MKLTIISLSNKHKNTVIITFNKIYIFIKSAMMIRNYMYITLYTTYLQHVHKMPFINVIKTINIFFKTLNSAVLRNNRFPLPRKKVAWHSILFSLLACHYFLSRKNWLLNLTCCIYELWREISINVVCATSKPAHILIRAFASRLNIL